MDRVLFFKIFTAHIPGKATSAADFLSPMLTDPNLTLQMKFMDHVPVRENETEAKAPYNSLLNISEQTPFSKGVQAVVNANFINQLKAHGLYQQFSAKPPNGDPDIMLKGFNFCFIDSTSNLKKIVLKTLWMIYRIVHNLLIEFENNKTMMLFGRRFHGKIAVALMSHQIYLSRYESIGNNLLV